MKLPDTLERKLRRFAIHNITLYLIIGQVFLYMASMTGQFDLGRVVLVPFLVLQGEWWRLITFLFIPPVTNVFFAFLAWYFFYLLGTALENHWGTVRYNLFLLIGYVLTVAVSFLVPMFPATNAYIGTSVFLAFAFLFPEFQLYIFFILPVKIKWLALLTWLGYAWELMTGTMVTRVLVLASIGNFLVFFGKDIVWKIRHGKWQMVKQAAELVKSEAPFHTCSVCGVTNLSNPNMEFRYCRECGGLGYCKDHIFDHEHKKK